MRTQILFGIAWITAAPVLGHEWHRQNESPFPAPPSEPLPFTEVVNLHTSARLWAAASPSRSVSTAPDASKLPNVEVPFDPVFAAFHPKVRTRSDAQWRYVESDGLPAHGMMIGITAWQQQVPLPQPYTGANAWRIPLHPTPSKTPVAIRNRFLRGAIAIAANGIPIFNPQNNRGEISAEIGELDQWGGHCGRADDYHYHAAPLHLQSVLGKSLPIAFALDGYPIYGAAEPDGSAPTRLDSFNGHETPSLGYHYHASTKYPYVNGGFHGEVVEAEGQVDPQPRATPVRPALRALRGAQITGFNHSADLKLFDLQYTVNGKPASIHYAPNSDGSWKFQFKDADGAAREETYRAEERRGGGGRRGEDRPQRRNEPEERRPSRRADVETPSTETATTHSTTAALTATPLPNTSQKSQNGFVLRSPAVSPSGELPAEFTGDGDGVTPPLEWSGAPKGTQSFALIMDHLPPDNGIKCYWTLWDIPNTVAALPKNNQDIGKLGRSFKGIVGYEPPHSRGPGAKTYTLHLYALSAPLNLRQPAREVTREILLEAIQGKVLATADLPVVYTRQGEGRSERDSAGSRPGKNRPEPQSQSNVASAAAAANLSADPSHSTDPRAQRRDNPRPSPGNRRGGADPKGLIKPTLSDTIKMNLYADNWFILYINGKLRAVDPIEFTPHNVVSVDLLPEYPMTIAVMAKDNADPKTGLEYGDHIGDGGFILKFSDGTVSNAKWKAKSFFKGPLNRNTVSPQVEHTPIPGNWYAVDFDDSAWSPATEYAEERVNPKESFYQSDFSGAKFIWTTDLDLDNTVVFRTRIEKPGWQPRWNTKPDLDITGAPSR